MDPSLVAALVDQVDCVCALPCCKIIGSGREPVPMSQCLLRVCLRMVAHAHYSVRE